MAEAHLDVTLVSRACEGDKVAVDQVLISIRPYLLRYFRSKNLDRFAADDLLQNTLLRIGKGLPRLKNVKSFQSFAFKAAAFELQDFYRGRYRIKEELQDEGEYPEWPDAAGHEAVLARLDIEIALQALKPLSRQILELKELGYRYREIAQLMGMTQAAVKMQVRRAFASMRKILEA